MKSLELSLQFQSNFSPSEVFMDGDNRFLKEFGKFKLDTARKVLWHDRATVAMPLKELELLCLLVENQGKLVTKDELLEKVWADSFVGESNLSRHIYLLRKTLKDFDAGHDLIENVPRRGYRFTGEVRDVLGDEIIIERHSVSETLIEIKEETKKNSKLALPKLSTSLFLLFSFSVLLLGGFAFWKSSPKSSPAKIQSIAVLPLKSTNESADDRALSLGFADALITNLGKLNSVKVISSVSVKRFADLPKEPPEIGKDLNVDSVLDGTFQRANGKLRVTLRLFRVSDGAQIWSESFDESESEIFKLEDAMARGAAQSLKINLSDDEQRQFAKRYTENRDAYEAYLRGRFFSDRRNAENYEKAIAEFEKAVRLDPNYALAYSGLADVFALQAVENKGERRDALYEKARVNAIKALQLDETLAEAHTSLGWIKRTHDWDWQGAEREFKRAIELNPNYVNAHQWYGFLLIALGRSDEALAELKKAREIDPLSKSVLINYLAVLTFRRESSETPAVIQQIIDLDDDKPTTQRLLSIDYLQRGDFAKVIETGNENISSDGTKNISSIRTANMVVAYARLGQDDKAREMLAYLEQEAKNDFESAFRLAMAYSDLGRKTEAIELLQKCFEVHEDRMIWLKIEPRFDNLREEPRYKEILRKMNLK